MADVLEVDEDRDFSELEVVGGASIPIEFESQSDTEPVSTPDG